MDRLWFKQILLTYLHLPYRWGGDNPIYGFDCSGLVQDVLSIVGLRPHGDKTAAGLLEHFLICGKTDAIETGTLLFFGNVHPTHVAIAFDGTFMLEAGGGDNKVLTVSDAIKRNAFIRIRPIASRRDLITAINLKYPWNAKEERKEHEYH